MAMMRREDAKPMIIHEWDKWAPKQTDPLYLKEGMFFFGYLQKEKPELLNFRDQGDKWQTVHGWLLEARRLTD
jgi:hypothetical protein